MRHISIRITRGRALLLVAILLLIGLLDFTQALAQAPPRSGQPYAEAALCARADVILCEDFDYPGNFSMSGGNTTWNNPALATKTFGVTGGTAARQINPVSQYPAQPAGSPVGGSAWAANWDPSKGTRGDGATWGVLRAPGSNYVNGLAPGKDVYIRFQYYVTANYTWPGDPRPDAYGYGTSAFPIDNKILFLYPPEGVNNPTGSAYDAGLYTNFSVFDPGTGSRFADALVVRTGDASDNYKFFPMDAQASANPQHMEYGPFQSTALRNPHLTPTPGKIFRFDTNRWYTLELHYKLGSGPGGQDGGIEVWVDGVKIYSAFDLATCGSGLGDCSGMGAVYLGAYHNNADTTAWNGQQVIDNLVIAKSYIGPPSGGSSAVANGSSGTSVSSSASPSVPSAGADITPPAPREYGDLLWQNTTTGDIGIWYMNGSAATSSAILAKAVPLAWRLVGTADLNGDGRPDLLWQNTTTGDIGIWYMNGSAATSSAILAKAVPLAWRLVGTADLNGDGRPDLLWQNTTTGDIGIWYMNGSAATSSAILAKAVPLAWRLVGTADLNGDGRPDLLWQNTTTGDIGIWYMNGSAATSSAILAKAVPLAWRLVGTADLNGDGRPDLLWQNTTTGDIGVWYMNGAAAIDSGGLATGVSLGWKLVGSD